MAATTARFRLTLLLLSGAMALVLALTAVGVASANTPTGLTAEICGDAVCLSWNPAGSGVSYQQVLYWRGNNPNDLYSGGKERVGSTTGQAQIPLDSLGLEPSEYSGEIETEVYSFQVTGVERELKDTNITYSNRVTLDLPRPYLEPEGQSHPRSLTAEICGESVCLTWIPGNGNFNLQQVQAWKGRNQANSDFNLTENVGLNDSEAQILLKDLKLKPTYSAGDTTEYSFQIAGIPPDDSDDPEYSNKVLLDLPREVIPRIDPSGLTAELCEESLCTSWTTGEGDYTYQGVKYWQTERPDDSYHHGGVTLINPQATGWVIPISWIRRHPGDTGEVPFTVRVEAVTKDGDAYEYVGYSNEVIVDIPVHLMSPADANEKR